MMQIRNSFYHFQDIIDSNKKDGKEYDEALIKDIEDILSLDGNLYQMPYNEVQKLLERITNVEEKIKLGNGEADENEEKEESSYDHLISCRSKLKITNIVELIKKRVSFFGMYDIHD